MVLVVLVLVVVVLVLALAVMAVLLLLVLLPLPLELTSCTQFIVGGDGEDTSSPDYPYACASCPGGRADSHHGYIPRWKAGWYILIPV